jgi:hypothetical protein
MVMMNAFDGRRRCAGGAIGAAACGPAYSGAGGVELWESIVPCPFWTLLVMNGAKLSCLRMPYADFMNQL